MPPQKPESIAQHLTARERIALFCAAADIDHTAAGLQSSTMQTLDVRGLIARDSTTRRYVLTDTGRVVFGALLGPAGFGLAD